MVRAAACTGISTEVALASLVEDLRPANPSVVLAFHGARHDGSVVQRTLQAAFPDAACLGCSTDVEQVGPQGLIEGGISAFAFGPPARAAVVWVRDLVGWRFEDGRPLVRRLARRLGRTLGPDLMLITLTDGLSGVEDRLLASLAAAAPGVALVGGGAGDDGRFRSTSTFGDGRHGHGSAVVCLLEPGRPFHPFAVHHMEEGDERMVVTAARPDERVLLELNGRPAARVYEELAGLAPGTLDRDPHLPLASPLHFGFRACGQLHVRAVLRAQGKGLALAGSVSEGLVVRAVRGGDLLGATRDGLARACAELADPEAVLLFSCSGRAIQARSLDQLHALGQAMTGTPAAGFSCIGEHFGALNVNYTLTGVAFGRS